jgi:hypothetical protein
MTFFSRQNAKQSRITDQVHDVIKRLGPVTQGAGVLSKETNLNVRDIWADLDLLEEEGKIVRTITPKDAGK